MDPLILLARPDKWFLGGGRGAIYAPPFPRFLAVPGFWDECYFADIRIPHLFGLLLAREDGRPVHLRGSVVEWRPDRMILEHTADGVRVRETRCVTDQNAWVSELRLESHEPLTAFQWSLLDVRSEGFGTPWQSLANASLDHERIEAVWSTAWPSEIEPDRTAVESEQLTGDATMLPPLPIHLAFGASGERLSYTVNLAQRHDDSALWETSLLPQKLRNGRLPGDEKLWVGTEPIEGLAHLVQQFALEPGLPLRVACGAGLTASDARSALVDATTDGVIERSEQSWRSYFASVPQFASSDPYLTHAYWYRWYGLRLNTVVGLPNLTAAAAERYEPFVTEGIGFFRNFVTYSAQAHLREVAWMHDPALAIGILDNLGIVQRDDGSFPGHNYSCRPSRDFYHADFASGMCLLDALHPGAVGKGHVATMRRYAEYLLRNRTLSKDPASPSLYDVFDQNETGQEYMSRYQFASEAADQWAAFRVSGVDATVYAHNLFAGIAKFRAADSPYARFATGARDGLARIAFDDKACFFCDVRPDGTRSPARPATGLYPLACADLSGVAQQGAVSVQQILDRWLRCEEQFWRPHGFPATAASDPTYSPDGEWKGRRLNCPWSGRSWPMANSHLVDGFAAAARLLEGRSPGESGPYRVAAGEAFMKAIRLLYHDGDPARPNSFEHYDPETGVPALYRGYDDYMHSWVVDLILRHAVGVQPGETQVDPLPLNVDWIVCEDIPCGEVRIDVRIERGKAPIVRSSVVRPASKRSSPTSPES